jgi:PTH1 family peptidyl-tRNA hydrolase
MFLIVGLGNPGTQYKNNRHNVGFMAVDELHRSFHFGPWKKNFQADFAEGQIDGVKVFLLKPMTYMNHSGLSVRAISQFYKIPCISTLVIHDELAIDPMKLKTKLGGGSGGHNGLKSIDSQITPNYYRLRIGIGHPGDRDMVSAYVLSDFRKTELDALDDCFTHISRAIPKFLQGKFELFASELGQHVVK